MAKTTISQVSRITALLAFAIPAALQAGVTQNISLSPATGAGPGGVVTATKTITGTADCLESISDLARLTDQNGQPAGTLKVVSTSLLAIRCSNTAPATVSCGGPAGNSSSLSITFEITIPNPPPAKLILVDTVDDFSASCRSTATASVSIVTGPPAPSLTIKKSVLRVETPAHEPNTVYWRERLQYFIRVTNEGTAPTVGSIFLGDVIPFGLDITDGGGCVIEGQKVNCELSRTLNKGETFIVVITVRVNSGPETILVNQAAVAGGGDPDAPLDNPKLSNIVTLNKREMVPQFNCGLTLPQYPPYNFECLAGAGGLGSRNGPGVEAASASGRFLVGVLWNAVRQGTSGVAQVVRLTSDTAYFWFFSSNNVELVLKVVDGRAVNGKFWVFYGALTNVEYIIEIIDSETGLVQGYFNPQDTQASNADTSPFGNAMTAQTEGTFQFIPMDSSGALSESAGLRGFVPDATAAAAACIADATTSCLNGGRFQVRVHWEALHLGTNGEGQAVPITSDTGYFWFFSANNIELVVKVVDGRPVNGKFWVFYGALTNVQYTITITDTLTGAVKAYFSPQDTQASAADTSAF